MKKIQVLVLLATQGCSSCASPAPPPTKSNSKATSLPSSATSAKAVESACGSQRVNLEGASIDLAPPYGFVDVCSKDREICGELDERYPPIVKTVGYFWMSSDWRRRQAGGSTQLSRYLIAQVSSRPASEFGELKRTTRERAGAVPDNSNAPEVASRVGSTNLGVLAETPDSISIGAILKPRPSLMVDSLPTQVIVNTALLTKGRVLILYVHSNVSTDADVAAAKHLSEDWLRCLRSAAP